MSVHLGRTWYFSALLVSDRYERPTINTYSIKMEFTALAEDNHQHNVAYQRMKFWMHDIMDSCVLISQDNPDIKSWQETGSRILIMPEDPVDQLVGIMLYSKLSAITEPHIMIDQVSVASPLDDDVIYHHYSDEDLGPFTQSGWWNDPRPVWQSKIPRGKGKVINLARAAEWKDHELDWEKSPQENTVMITKINNEDQ